MLAANQYTHPAAAISPSAFLHRQTGGMVPGSGHGDIIPAMLEPGEAIIPRYLVPLIAPILAAHRVPGFGGMPQSSSSHFAAGGIVPHMLGFPDPARLQGDAGKFAFTLIDGITKALNAAGAKKIADALVSKIGKEVALAKNVSSAAMQGQGYGNAGLLGGMDVTPARGRHRVRADAVLPRVGEVLHEGHRRAAQGAPEQGAHLPAGRGRARCRVTLSPRAS